MTIDLTFDKACQSLKDEYPEISDDINNFSNLLLILGVAATGPAVAVAVGTTATPLAVGLTAVGILANLFGVKNEIPRIVKSIINTVTRRRGNDPLDHFHRLERAYCLLCYVAFFEALGRDKCLASFLKKAGVTREEKLAVANQATREVWGPNIQASSDDRTGGKPAFLEFKPTLPHPAETFEEQIKQLQPLYGRLTLGTEQFFKKLAVWEKASRQDRSSVSEALKNLPVRAAEYFKAQYYVLAVRYEEFYIWSNLQEQEETRRQLQNLSVLTQKYVELADMSKNVVDTGFKQLEVTIRSLPDLAAQTEVGYVLMALEKTYTRALEKPIFDIESKEGISGLTYPKQEQIFLPQEFRVLRYTGKEQLEQEMVWKHAAPRNDLGIFLLSYFQSPYSVQTPLIILGDPGSGKSLLTSMIAACWATTAYTPIRIPLRNIRADTRIQRQIEAQLELDSGGEVVSWGQFARHLETRSALVIFDGYDELLQATGSVFSDYLQTVRRFQEEELDLDRPTRTIVTSRRTLIGKADIPIGATILRLCEFNETKQQRWIDIWNATNADYFQQHGVRPFKVPQNNEKIKELAQQPLLLLMLALYDCEGNRLHKARDLDRTLLYQRLLHRFIERELAKETNFTSLPEKSRKEKIASEMERLGVAAVGMFNRRALYIREDALSKDLHFFGKERTFPEAKGLRLQQGSSLLGSFFFVQKAEARQGDQSVQESAHELAYEFLHATFGEFLTADFILHQVLRETNALYSMRTDEYLQAEYWQKLANFSRFSPSWFTCLMYAPLFSRPVIMKMMGEWLPHCFKESKCKEPDFLQDLETIVYHHIKLLLEQNTLPTMMIEREKCPFDALPTIGFFAIYTLNMILLRVMFGRDGFVFDEEKFAKSADGTRAWDRLAYLWRSWFSLETLSELATVLDAERDNTKIVLKMRKNLRPLGGIGRFYQVISASQALADNITSGLAGLLVDNPLDTEDEQANLSSIRRKLEAEQVDGQLNAILSMKMLQSLRRKGSIFRQDALSILQAEIRAFFETETRKDAFVTTGKREAIASLFAEMTRIAQELADDQGVEVEGDDFIRVFFGDQLISIEEFRLSIASNDQDAIDWYVMSSPIFKEKGGELQSQRILTEVIRFIQKSGRSVHHNINIKQIQKIIHKQGHLSMELAAALVGLARETGDQETINFIYHYYSKNMTDYAAPISIKLATQLVKSARDKRDQHISGYFVEYLLRYLRKHKDIPVELSLELFKLIRETSDKTGLIRFIAFYIFEVTTAERRLPITLMIELLNTLQEFDHQQEIQESVDLFFVPYIKQQILPNVPQELVVPIIKFGRKINDLEFPDHFRHDYLKKALNVQSLVPVELAIELVKLAQETSIYEQASIETFYYKNITSDRCYIGLLPIDTIVDLRRLAQKFGDGELVEKIDERLKI
ncbi:NACHT domain-containing protein [Reticulibacter mediterranei]|nr:hypothetical protein [Reticulibacter mediterranei]